ncbi:Nucleoside-diphosphatase mig-23 [Symbiodinium microadriaticum]|uniref:Nucleoside-diphosphatase mig-23 n=1 Tax=Symbiodinium microadriaticum TaxID=2951 RepID=A0A1Q9ETZ4_SYMMI|nr:Nucleoside-diphosphatase mig-23 [Symbiodinium microadriaticum]
MTSPRWKRFLGLSLCLAGLAGGSTSGEYFAVCDAGSTGTRLYVFLLDAEGGKAKSVFVKKRKPGLSSYRANPDDAVPPLLELLKEGAATIPEERRAKVPLLIFGTAGMRLLPAGEQSKIWSTLHAQLAGAKDFPFDQGAFQARTVSGDEEGLWAVLATNFLMGRMGHDLLSHGQGKPLGLMDLGGSSTQIGIPSPVAAEKGINFSSGVLVKSYLGFGMTHIQHKVRSKFGSDLSCYMPGSQTKEEGPLQGDRFGDAANCRKLIADLLQQESTSCLAESQSACLGDLKNPVNALRGGVRHVMELPLLRVMHALMSGADSTVEQKEKYRPQVLAKCVCTPGTEYKSARTNFVRLALGTLLERFGLVNVQCGVMSFEALWVAMVAAITASWNYALICFFIGCAGAMFVTNQFWCSLAFAPNVCVTANAIAAGWSSLGGGVTQIFMMLVLFSLTVASGMEPNIAWRVSMVVPAVMFVICAICMKLMCWDMPTARNHDPAVTGNAQRPSWWDYVDVLRDVRGNQESARAIEGDVDFYGVSGLTYVMDFVRWWLQNSEQKHPFLDTYPKPTLNELQSAVDLMCSGQYQKIKDWTDQKTKRHQFTDYDNLPFRCFQANYILVLLGEVYGFAKDSRKVTFALEVDGEDLEWPLGALLHGRSQPGQAEATGEL